MENWYSFKGDNSVQIVCLPSEKGSILKGNNLLPIGNKFFPFWMDTFSEGNCFAGKQRKSQKLSFL